MSRFIKYDKKGIIIDADALQYRNGMSLMELIRNDPLKDKRRKTIFQNMRNMQTKKLNPKMRELQEAVIQFEKVMEYNQKLIDKGLDPKNPKDAAQFKVFDPNKITVLMNIFSAK